MELVVELNRSERKLLHKAGMYRRKASMYYQNGDKDVYKLCIKKYDEYLDMLIDRIKLNEDKEIKKYSLEYVTPSSTWNELVVTGSHLFWM